MKLLLHTCCAPCLIYPYSQLRLEFSQVNIFFYNPNIHPFKEFRKRVDALEDYVEKLNAALIIEKKYGLVDFLRKVVFNETTKCDLCYYMRIEKTASTAKKLGFDAFSTTLLYSKYQNHTKIVATCNAISTLLGISFFYQDFREGWQIGVDKAVELDIYRQPYCGCIFSEQERYDKSFSKR
jgi:epoxyqueuosine reductase